MLLLLYAMRVIAAKSSCIPFLVADVFIEHGLMTLMQLLRLDEKQESQNFNYCRNDKSLTFLYQLVAFFILTVHAGSDTNIANIIM